jgi:signal transduction histidine kinase
MSGSATVAASSMDPLPARVAALLRNAPQRLRERPFWIIQAGVLTVTVLHILGELWADHLVRGLHPALHHVPVVLYLAPIAYASLRYGIEGGVLTGVWSALLTMPNILVWHAQDLEWLTELVYVGVVVSAGVVMAVPVERERRERQRAEATSRRLTLLNDIATLTLTADLDHTLQEALARLVADLRLDAACVAGMDPDIPQQVSMIAQHPRDHSDGDVLEACVQQLSPAYGSRPHASDQGVLAIPFETDLPDPGPAGRISGVLAVRTNPARPLGDDDRQLLGAVSNQLAIALANSRLKDLERDRVRSYARQVTWAQEEERKRISRELHDEAAQNLVAIRRDLDAVSASSTDRAEPALERLRALTAQTLAGLRRFSHDLRPPVLDDLGLASATESLVADVQGRSHLVVELAVTGTPQRLPADIELALFRIAQSALHNVEHHAHATRAVVALAFEPDRTRLAISDDGCGFRLPADIADLVHTGKLGLVGMYERAQLANGTLQITSAPGDGTRVQVEVPRRPGHT